jgi:putative ribosome biogenesis GTPase RsgA
MRPAQRRLHLSFTPRTYRNFCTSIPKPPPKMAPQVTPSLRPVVLCGPSGAGKSTLIKKLQDEFPGQYNFSVSREL